MDYSKIFSKNSLIWQNFIINFNILEIHQKNCYYNYNLSQIQVTLLDVTIILYRMKYNKIIIKILTSMRSDKSSTKYLCIVVFEASKHKIYSFLAFKAFNLASVYLLFLWNKNSSNFNDENCICVSVNYKCISRFFL